jgi:hypothetical protein
MSAHPLTLDEVKQLLPGRVLLYIDQGQKAPLIAGWQTLSFEYTQSPSYQNELGSHPNTGVLLGDGLVAIDFDDDSGVEEFFNLNPSLTNETLVTKGARGAQVWLQMEDDSCWPPNESTYPHCCVPVAGKGEWRGGKCQSVVRGIHPSGRPYTCLCNKSPAEIHFGDLQLPAWMADAIRKHLAPPVSTTEPEPITGTGFAQPANLDERVKDYLHECDPAISGQGGHITTYRVACQVGNGFALSPNQLLEAMHYYNQKCEPPWSEKELKHKVDEALKAQHNKPRGYLLDEPASSGNGQPQPDPPFSQLLKEDFKNDATSEEIVQTAEPTETIDLDTETNLRLERYFDNPEPFPTPMRPEAFHGIAGRIVQIMAGHCESSPETLLLQGLVILGNIAGRSAWVYAGGSHLFPNEFVVCVGDTARARKGTAYSMWEHLAELANTDWLRGCLASQVQTGEGIVHRVRDERYGVRPGSKGKKNDLPEEELLDPGISDKRLLILEEEFSYTLKMAQRSGNTLSETLRQAWDSRQFLNTSNKNSPLRASHPHVSLIGHTTRGELINTLKMVDLNNGMANRVLWCAARRTGDMPDAEFLDWNNHPDILESLKRIFNQRPPSLEQPEFFRKTPEAKNYWDQLYRRLNAQKRNSTIDDVLARDTAHILKLALIYAICDQVTDIRTQHIEAAVAVADFCQNSARWIFGQATGNKLANNILWELRRTPGGLTRTDISSTVCYGNTPKTQLDRAFTDLIQNGLARMATEKAEKGQIIERWFALN